MAERLPSAPVFVGTAAPPDPGFLDASPCTVCAQAAARYTCARCRVRYCAVGCFRAHAGGACAEAFARDSVVGELAGRRASDEDREGVEDLLRRIRTPSDDPADSESLAAEAAALRKEEEEVKALEVVLARLDAREGQPDTNLDGGDDEDTLMLLSQEQREAFLRAAADDRVLAATAVTPWTPWWTQDEHALIVDVIAPVSPEGRWPEAMKSAELRPVKELARTVSPEAKFILVDLVYAVAWVSRRYNGSVSATAAPSIRAVSPVLSGSSRSHVSVPAALEASLAQAAAHERSQTNSARSQISFLRLLLFDVAQIFSRGRRGVVCALSVLRGIFADEVAAGQPKDRVALGCQKKAEFFCCFAADAEAFLEGDLTKIVCEVTDLARRYNDLTM
jgi:HIT zinc finger